VTITEIVTKKLKLFSQKKVVTLLSGNYDSLFRGRGLEIDSLREYLPGDDIKDIDWKATARTKTTHTRLYTALRDQRIVVMADTSKSMLLDGYTGLNKQDATYAVCAMLGAFVRHNQDLMALCATGADGTVAISRYNNTSRHLESILRSIDAALHAPNNPSTSLDALGKKLLSVTKKRSAVFVISDATPDLQAFERLITPLATRHHVFYVQLAPSWPFMNEPDDVFDLKDIETDEAVMPGLMASAKLKHEWRQGFTAWQQESERLCRARGIPYGLITDAANTPEVLQKMFMQAKRYAVRGK